MMGWIHVAVLLATVVVGVIMAPSCEAYVQGIVTTVGGKWQRQSGKTETKKTGPKRDVDVIMAPSCGGICPRNCNFNKNNCGYTMGGKWQRQSGETDTKKTGPKRDVDGKGTYVYAEASGAKPGEKSRLQSPLFNSTKGLECFSFQYHMYGKGMGILRVYVGNNNNPEWSMSGNQGKGWKKDRFNVDSAVPFHIIFEAARGRSYKSDIALDNLVLADKPCSGGWGHWSSWSTCSTTVNCKMGTKQSTRECDNPTPVKGGKDCEGLSKKFTPCAGGICPTNCNFNENNCGYTMDKRWRRQSGRTRTSKTGPCSDVDGDGMYVYAEATRAEPGETSRLQSPLFNPTKGCFSFQYHMYGKGMGTLSVYVGNNNKPEWSMSGNQGKDWKKKEFNVDSTVRFNITFQAAFGQSYKSDIALDNLVLEDKPCSG